MPPLVDFRIRQTTKENIGDISALAAWHTTARYLNPCTRNLSVSLALALFTAHLLFFKTYRHTTVTWEWHKHGHARITLGFWEMSHLPTNQDLILFLRKKNCIKCKFLESPSRIKNNSNKRKKKTRRSRHFPSGKLVRQMQSIRRDILQVGYRIRQIYDTAYSNIASLTLFFTACAIFV